jgi:patatin-like phospholipase/acyl hydrolase
LTFLGSNGVNGDLLALPFSVTGFAKQQQRFSFKPQNKATMYKILSLDGGGSWAVLQLLSLMERYGDKQGHEILRNYDLVIANSGGSIILTALAEDMRLSEALKLFNEQSNREKIFFKNSFRFRFFPVNFLRLFMDFGPKYSAPHKMKAFNKLFPIVDKMQMDELPAFIKKPSLKIVVCTYDAYNNRAKFFRSYGSGPEYDSVRLTQAAHGSSNAPVQYFDFPARFKAKNTNVFFELWDGALGGFNNPVAAGIIEAIRSGVRKDDIAVVSLGTGNATTSAKAKHEFFQARSITTIKRVNSLKFWHYKNQLKYFMLCIMNQAKTILYQPPDWANFVAYMLLFGENFNDPANLERFARLSPLIHADANTPKEVKELLNELYELDMDLTEEKDVAKLHDCFKEWVKGNIVNHPIEYKINRDNSLQFQVGHKTFAEAMAAWRKIA